MQLYIIVKELLIFSVALSKQEPVAHFFFMDPKSAKQRPLRFSPSQSYVPDLRVTCSSGSQDYWSVVSYDPSTSVNSPGTREVRSELVEYFQQRPF